MAGLTIGTRGLSCGRLQVGLHSGLRVGRTAFQGTNAPRSARKPLRTAQKAHRQPCVTATAGTGTVRIIIQGRHLEVTDAIHDYVEKKIAKSVEKFESQVKEVDVALSVRGGDTGTKGVKEQKAEVTVHTLRNGSVRSEVVADSLYASVDLVCDKIQRQLRKVKEKAISKGKWPGGGGPKGGPKFGEILNQDGEPPPLDKNPEVSPEIVRVKYFQLEPMNENEAIEQMQRLDHDFHVYQDKKTDNVHVVYKRHERGYGLIIPMNEGSESS